jgi:diguanylate cyclase (GGDEF)-like protein/PAS domain S-box-containing protein
MSDPVNDFYRIVLEALPTGVYVVNREGKIALWSAGAEKLTGYLRQDVLGRLQESELLELVDPPITADEYLSSTASIGTLRPATRSTKISVRCKDGRYLAGQLRSVPLRDESGKYLGTLGAFEAESPARFTNRRQDKLAAYGCLDSVTGVLNHSLIQARLKESLSLHALYPVPFAVMCYAVDDLPKLTERYGQAAVDAALRTIAHTFESGLRPTDFLGRWLDQEFVAILPECTENDVVKVGQRLSRLVQKAGVQWWGDVLHATVSIGATVVHDNDNVSSLLAGAEKALRESAEAGGNRVVVIGSSGE